MYYKHMDLVLVQLNVHFWRDIKFDSNDKQVVDFLTQYNKHDNVIISLGSTHLYNETNMYIKLAPLFTKSNLTLYFTKSTF